MSVILDTLMLNTRQVVMTVNKPKRPANKRRKTPVTAAAPVAGTRTGSGAEKKAEISAATDTDAMSLLLSLTPSGAETTSATSSLLTVKNTKAVPQQKTSLATAQLIRRYHVLNKELSKCLARIDNARSRQLSTRNSPKTLTPEQRAADLARIAEIRQEMDDLGGLDMYQKASTLGQSKQRGGDSSKWLISIFKSYHPQLNRKTSLRLRLLDIGALSPHNYQKHSSWIHATTIDLNPQDPLITKMDFLEMPMPSSPEELFDIVCLSLVVNFVGDPTQRGEILRRSTRFLVSGTGVLYLVLPLPCIQNSRYMDHELLLEMMISLGYTTLIKHHFARKLAYYAFQLDDGPTDKNLDSSATRTTQSLFPKKLRHDKPNRNNFCIILA
ncbi:hypothetical protein BGZ65_001371 [Modicella reniformis]|uniref:25S rRNA adenine-N(1) methyltransferase n=1 Tax=Modicella reniformis TaxID=1440133 RepID=A0A9P6MJM4_9FUNG|nr:hypothetical protein BGZ65_001371 [Modicella reniformis]